ncbi:MAG: hypothetical protein IKE66_10165 [Hyphomicrobium sp.]|nr:hypothetical protein [Hyphomicrobium sp.]
MVVLDAARAIAEMRKFAAFWPRQDAGRYRSTDCQMCGALVLVALGVALDGQSVDRLAAIRSPPLGAAFAIFGEIFVIPLP